MGSGGTLGARRADIDRMTAASGILCGPVSCVQVCGTAGMQSRSIVVAFDECLEYAHDFARHTSMTAAHRPFRIRGQLLASPPLPLSSSVVVSWMSFFPLALHDDFPFLLQRRGACAITGAIAEQNIPIKLSSLVHLSSCPSGRSLSLSLTVPSSHGYTE